MTMTHLDWLLFATVGVAGLVSGYLSCYGWLDRDGGLLDREYDKGHKEGHQLGYHRGYDHGHHQGWSDAAAALDPPDMTGYEPFVASSGERNVRDLPALAPSTGSQGGEHHERVWADQMRHDLAPEHIQDLPGPARAESAVVGSWPVPSRAGEPHLAYTLDPESLWQLRRMTLMGRDRERWAASMGFAVTDSGDLAVAA